MPSSLGPPSGIMHRPSVRSYEEAVSYQQGTPVHHNAGSEGVFDLNSSDLPLPYPREPPFVPPVLPPVGSMDYLIPGYSRDSFVSPDPETQNPIHETRNTTHPKTYALNPTLSTAGSVRAESARRVRAERGHLRDPTRLTIHDARCTTYKYKTATLLIASHHTRTSSDLCR